MSYYVLPYHLPDCVCSGSGWVDTKPITEFGREWPAVARCDRGGPIEAFDMRHWEKNHKPPVGGSKGAGRAGLAVARRSIS